MKTITLFNYICCFINFWSIFRLFK